MLAPKKQKYRKAQRNRSGLKGKALTGNAIAFGDYGLKALQKGEISARQIEAARRAMTRYIKRGGKIWIRIFPHKPITKKAAEVPMGSGKGALEYHVATVKPGCILFEMTGLPEDAAREAFRRAAQKLPIHCRFARPHIR